MSEHVKNPKVPHQWDEVGQIFIQVQWDWIIPKGKTTIFSKQHCSQLQVYGRRNPASGTPSPRIHIDTYLDIHRFKMEINASFYPKEMLTVLAMYLIIYKWISLPQFFPWLLKQPEATPLRAARSLLSRPGSMWYGDSWADVNSYLG